jgi:hypothetical protein
MIMAMQIDCCQNSQFKKNLLIVLDIEFLLWVVLWKIKLDMIIKRLKHLDNRDQHGLDWGNKVKYLRTSFMAGGFK